MNVGSVNGTGGCFQASVNVSRWRLLLGHQTTLPDGAVHGMGYFHLHLNGSDFSWELGRVILMHLSPKCYSFSRERKRGMGITFCDLDFPKSTTVSMSLP